MDLLIENHYEWIKNNPELDETDSPYYSDNMRAILEKPLEFHENFKSYIKQKDVKKYYYLVTFTIHPEYASREREIEEYIRRQFLRVPLRIKEAWIVRELTATNVPHWHVAVCTYKALKKDRFNYYVKKYGFVDISKSRLNSLEESLNYISKVEQPTKITR